MLGTVSFLNGRQISAIASCVVIRRLASPVALVFQQHCRRALQRRVTHPSILLPVIFGKDCDTWRTIISHTLRNSSDTSRASCNHVVQATKSYHTTIISPKGSPWNRITVIHYQYPEFLGCFIESNRRVQLCLYEIASSSTLSCRSRYARWPPSSHGIFKLLKSSEPIRWFRFASGRIVHGGLFPWRRGKSHHRCAGSSPCIPGIWPLLGHQAKFGLIAWPLGERTNNIRQPSAVVT